MEILIWLATALMLILGCWVQTALGFGMAMVAAPVVVVLRPEWVPVMLTFMAFALSGINAWNTRRDLQLRLMPAPFLTRIPGTAAGAWLLLQLNTAWLQIAVAASVLLAVLLSLFSLHFHATPAKLGWAGFFSGFMGTTTSIGGPPMALVMQHGDPRTVRANLSFFFTYSCLLSLGSYAIAGILDWKLLLESLIFVPCAFIGFALGLRARNYVDAGRFRPLLLLLCAGASLTALFSVLL